MTKKIKNTVFAFLAGTAIALTVPFAHCQTDPLESGFTKPPPEQRVGCYWYWIDNKITKEGIVADLHAMKKAGVTCAYIGLTGGGKDVKFMSDQWWELIHTAMKTATELGIEIGMFNCPGWSQSGGPWIKPSQSMRYLASVQRVVTGPKKISEKIALSSKQLTDVSKLPWGDESYQSTPKDFQDVKVLAFPVKAANIKNHFEAAGAKVTFSPNVAGKTFPVKLSEKGESSITLALPESVSAQGLLIKIKGSFYSQGELQAKVNGRFATVKTFRMDRTDMGLSRGFAPFSPFAISFPKTTASEFRLVFRNTNNRAVVAGVSLTEAPIVERFPEKTFAKMFNKHAPPWDAFMWETETNDASLSIDPKSVVDISEKLAADGTLEWDVPEGDWVILRTGMLPTGVQNSPVVEGGSGPEVDKLSYSLTQYHFDSYLGEILRRIPAADRKSWKYNIMDSYEKGGQNFTDNFFEIFKTRYGYDPLPYIPAYFGFPVGSPELSDRFLWDMRRLVSDRIANEYARALVDRSHQNGQLTWFENYGSWGFAGEFLQYGGRTDEIGGEFWTTDRIGEFEIRCATSSAHTYGKSRVWAEALTSGGGHYTYHPGNLKRRGDWAFAEGVNAFILHVYIQQHADNTYPGIDAWYNVQFNRKNTWFSQLDLYTDYIRRCGFLLQKGVDVSDVAYFIGEDAPKMCGVTDPPTPAGYHYDHINAEVLVRGAKVVNKRLVLPHGTSYRVLVLPPQDTIRPEVFEKIAQFAEAGLPVIATVRPVRSPSLENYPAADLQVQKIAARLWDNKKILNISVEDFLKKEIKLPPDFAAPSPALQYAHRKDGDTDIYFVTNQSGGRIQASPAFRVYGKQPELWNPVTGKRRQLPAFTQITENGTTSVPLQLEAEESAFIVFRKNAKAPAKSELALNFPELKVVAKINSPWTVVFESDEIKRGPAGPVVFEKLTDWSKNADERIKYFSGTAIYKTSFDLGKKPDGELYLDLGKVAVMAKVKINGSYAGGAWTPPYRVDIAPFVKSGKNEVEIEVVNTWANRILGDRKLPAEQRKLRISRGPKGDLYESGLLGPVQICRVAVSSDKAQPLSGTKPIEWTENYFERNSRLITEFLDNKIAGCESSRAKYWNRDFSAPDAYQKSVVKNRERLKFITGVRDNRVGFNAPELICTLNQPALVAENATHSVFAIRWKVFADFSAEGLLIKPKSGNITKTIIHLPQAGITPEKLLSGGDEVLRKHWFTPPSKDEQMIIPLIVSRNFGQYRLVQLPNREFIYRQAYQLGRHIIGYEVQEVLALTDWLKKTPAMKIRVQGQGDGGLLALYSAAVDTRIDEAVVVDYFHKRDRLCDEPIDRNVFGLLNEFGDAEIATLVCPRPLTVAVYNAPELSLPFNKPWKSKYGGAPGELKKLNPENVKTEVERAKKLVEQLKVNWIEMKKDVVSAATNLPAVPTVLSEQRIVKQLENHTQQLLKESVFTRREFWKKLNTSSPKKIAETIGWYRDYFSKNVVGEFEEPLLPINPRTRFFRDCKTYTVYEVELDVYEGLTSFGFLVIPKTLKEGQKLPAVVGQHGLEVDAKMHLFEFNNDMNHAMITKLCNGGYVTFAPQGIFKLDHKFRFNQRQLNSLGKNLFAIMTAQQKQIVKFMQTLPFVEADKIGFYGCSYGGTTAMFVPPLIPEYRAVVCSANFNYWNERIAGTSLSEGYTLGWSELANKSYMFDWQYEVFDFNLANTFDHSDMVRLIAPRPFMVERGHNDLVAKTENVTYEFGKVRYYYDMCLKMPERAEILFLPGGHMPYVTPILPFLDKWLKVMPFMVSGKMGRRN